MLTSSSIKDMCNIILQYECIVDFIQEHQITARKSHSTTDGENIVATVNSLTIFFIMMFNWPISVLCDWCIYNSCYYHHQIGSINLSHCYHIFPGCVPEMFITSYDVTHCIWVPEKTGICFHYYCAVYDECKYSDTFWLADRTRLFVQYTISLSSLCKFIWRHWTYKMPVIYFVDCVSKIGQILSVIHYTICGAVCFHFYPFLLWSLREYIYFVLLSSSNRRYELLPIV